MLKISSFPRKAASTNGCVQGLCICIPSSLHSWSATGAMVSSLRTRSARSLKIAFIKAARGLTVSLRIGQPSNSENKVSSCSISLLDKVRSKSSSDSSSLSELILQFFNRSKSQFFPQNLMQKRRSLQASLGNLTVNADCVVRFLPFYEL